MILEKDQLPGMPRAGRVLCKPNPPVEVSECGLHIPQGAQLQPNVGVIVHAGLVARDAFHDHGDQIGDVVWWGKFAGVVDFWDRVIEYGKKPCKMEDHSWDRRPSPGKDSSAFECSKCQTTRRADIMILINHDDILCNVTAERRRESGQFSVTRGETVNGTTRHFIDRKDK